ncbi:PqqD family protein [Desulfofustis glycolicus]|uniref:Coenzyme PQQ synthesis protein D (PqqD) n=1 Tax=Desulfofustis glycolicus DSM 9705 TaxID=1121409 RepID=A0A1M5TN95_9BACT|nr:PqqD family protein [Desulfofustis glycolicus]MCB2216504.1 PqqD family protein [Desulfobulbaceae bacterium]SHH52184.1 Coenzyme PQQ synthesis protein D (PqqD) [Desulfofustis glycolicus DSM 9705]
MLSRNILKVDDSFILETFDSEIVLYSPHKNQAAYLNESAHLVWLLCREQRTLGDIIAVLEEAYPAARQQIREDVLTAVEALIALGAVALDG